jgi:predicted O-linked N-acetylglucosamine transferase (SPINDLY family)
MGEIKSAIINYEKAILLDPNSASNYMNFGNVLSKIKDNEAALKSYNKAMALNPNFVDIYYNRAVFFEDLKKFELALIDYKKTLELEPNFKFLLGKIFSAKIKLCDWSNYEENLAKIREGLLSNKLVSEPFLLLAAEDSLKLNLEVAKAYVNSAFPEDKFFSSPKNPCSSERIKLAYYSADFHNHATSYLMAGLFEMHDRSKFELIAFSFGPESNDEMRSRVEGSFDKFIDVRLKSDNEIVKISREMGVDIAVDLKGFTKDMRLGIFAKRVAPIQVNYLGYPGTMAAGYIDYIIADKVLIPDERHRKYYLEKVVYLPNSYQVNDSRREISSRVYAKKEFSLPEESFVFCCFNNNYKITPQVFDVWMNILKRVSNSVLWLLEDNEIAADNLRKEAVRRGVDESRLIFAKRMKLPDHLARHKLADLFIDTIPCNAHTTCSDALWALLPVLTIAGESFASRVSASLLTAVGLEEMIVDNFVDYEERAVEFAINREKLQLVKEKLQCYLMILNLGLITKRQILSLNYGIDINCICLKMIHHFQ